MPNPVDLRLYVILDPGFAKGRPLDEIARRAIAGGATVLQLRAKDVDTRTLLALTQAVLAIARAAGVPLIVNDRVDVALAAGADGAHVGEQDLPVADARRLLGPDAILGASALSAATALAAARDGADYLGIGDVFGTSSKPDARPPMGLAGLRAVAAASTLPAVAIGGIHAANAASTLAMGAVGVSVISAVVSAEDVEAAARTLRRVVDRGLAEAALADTPPAEPRRTP
jgi:thiamine-phosphate pyrophosphorylase